jgi:hypothetical protein
MVILGLALSEWIALIQGVLSFPSAILSVVKLLQKTPAEQQADIVAQVNAMITASQTSPDGRPKWES